NNGTIQGWANHYMILSDEVINRIFGDNGAVEDPQTLENSVIWGVEDFTSGTLLGGGCGEHLQLDSGCL
ncbi:Hypothetical predicted protein, partial [Marmota monax]